jgi:hypothetical protein
MIEHVSTCEEENCNQTDGSPEIPVLDKRREVWCGNGEEGNEAENGGGNGHAFHVVEWSTYRGLLALWKQSADPGVNGIGGLLSAFCQ